MRTLRQPAAGFVLERMFWPLALDALVYCLPCLLLLVAGLTWRQQITSRLQRVYERLGAERVQPRSIPAAAGLVLLATVVAVLALTP